MIINIFLTLIFLAMLSTILLDVLKEPFRMCFPQTVAWWELRKKRIDLDRIEKENHLLERKKLAIEQNKALEDFLQKHGLKDDL